MVLGEMCRLHGRAGAHEALQTGTGLGHRGLDPAFVSGLSALVEDGPDKVGDKIGGDPPLQLG